MTDATTLLVGPFNRVEGDLEIRLEVREGRVSAAYANSPLFRGFESILQGKSPIDALTITPRICGICSISQSMAAAQALADLAGKTPSPEGAKVAQLLHMIENASDHLMHFNMFFMPDFARAVYADRPWWDQVLTRFTAAKGSALKRAVEARAGLMHVTGLLGGKWPHTLAIQPGGVTRAPSVRDKVRISADLAAFRAYLEEVVFGGPLEQFAELATIVQLSGWTGGDVALFLAISDDLALDSSGCGEKRYLSFGAYPGPNGPLFKRGTLVDGTSSQLVPEQIVEEITHSWMLGQDAHPSRGMTRPDEDMREDAYSWCKAPRLAGETFETGALARQAIDDHPLAVALAAEGSVRARVIGRLLELARTQIEMERLLASIDPRAAFMRHVRIPDDGEGVGMVEAARGALGHWVRVEGGVITSYQIIAPTTWNFSPRDGRGVPGPVEAALVGAEVRDGEETPVSVQHIVRSFDPCMVCTVH
ncbi:nickel-dependent hydrogenase large subunit [Celeribacter halophilus]|uniref:Hydrogenase large subunit n=1 Tax=Celeribacter halophilus TaxID=576117 RepID=A0A1I3QS46_9RHOB|nr:nickel-dependent hydrogenase large subunit [Celeribacter halophilus]PZX13352.1 hydrogenase large subunit [Celeribacter halophilus]SFJ35937.1 hydrogenase large subunit [Celeribacter halophilus]